MFVIISITLAKSAYMSFLKKVFGKNENTQKTLNNSVPFVYITTEVIYSYAKARFYC